MNYLADLDPAQREAVFHTEGPLLVLAGAGSGKTRVITYKIAYLLEQLGADASRILAITFTNKAAEEMKHRVARLLPSRLSLPWIGTFHGFCARLLRRHIESLGEGYTSDFSIYDEEDQLRLIRLCLREGGFDEQRLAPRWLLALISRAKCRGLVPADLRDDPEWTATSERARLLSLFERYQEHLRAANALDFDDLLLKATLLLRREAHIRRRYQKQFRFILVDEYQDTNPLQFDLLRLLSERVGPEVSVPEGEAPDCAQHLCVVGDPDQSIYRWRGADLHNVLEFERHFPNARVITLDKNYRSTKTILSLANALIRHNQRRKEKTLWTENGEGSPVGYYQAETAEDEAEFVLQKIRAHLEQDPRTRVAVLYRTNAQSRLFEEACRRAGLPFQMVGGFSFYKRAEIRDILAYVRLALNPWDDESLRRIVNVPPRGIGKKTLEALERLAQAMQISLWEALRLAVIERRLPERVQESAQAFLQLIERLRARTETHAIADLFRAVLHETGYIEALRAHSSLASPDVESRIQNLEELLSAAAEADARGHSVREFVDQMALASETDEYNPDAPVTLMTMHSAKGLEFPVVFIVGLEEGLFPHARSHEDAEELEEERRLFYVAITRAQQYLYLTHARTRRRQGHPFPTKPSRFLQELPRELLHALSPGERAKPARREPPSGTPSPFRTGMRVRHPLYGIGQIIGREDTGSHTVLVIVFPGLGKRKFVEGIAPLQIIS